MLPKVSCTRMELLARKAQIKLAQQGRELLEQKRTALVKELLHTADTVMEHSDILQQVANALRISVESLYVRAGILPDEEYAVSTVSEAIEHDPDLTDEQKSALLNVYESFLAQ